MTKKFDPEHLKKIASELQNFLHTELVQTERYQEQQVQIIPDNSMNTGKFKPHPLLPNAWKAHPVTIEALRSDLFMVGDGFEDFELLYTCEDCLETLDVQFWKRCPHCSKSFPREFDNPNFKLKPWEKNKLISEKPD